MKDETNTEDSVNGILNTLSPVQKDSLMVTMLLVPFFATPDGLSRVTVHDMLVEAVKMPEAVAASTIKLAIAGGLVTEDEATLTPTEIGHIGVRVMLDKIVTVLLHS